MPLCPIIRKSIIYESDDKSNQDSVPQRRGVSALVTGAPPDLRVVFVVEFVFMFIGVDACGVAVVIGTSVEVTISVVVTAGVVVIASVVVTIGVVVQAHQQGHIAGVSDSPSVVGADDIPIPCPSIISAA